MRHQTTIQQQLQRLLGKRHQHLPYPIVVVKVQRRWNNWYKVKNGQYCISIPGHLHKVCSKKKDAICLIAGITGNCKTSHHSFFFLGCTLEARAFQRDIDNYRQLNAQIVGVSVDPPEKNAQFCSSEGLDFYMLSDTGGRVSKLYGTALSIPGFGTFSNRQTYIIDPAGNLRYVFTDVESRIARHSGEVLEKLTELEQANA